MEGRGHRGQTRPIARDRQESEDALFLHKSTLEPAPVHLQLLGSVHQHAPVNAKIMYVEEWLLGAVHALILVSLMVLARPDGTKLIFVEEVHTGAITAHIEVLLEVPPLAETHLGQVPSSIIAEAYLATRLEHLVHVLDRLPPLLRRQRGEDEDEQRHVDGRLAQAGRQLVGRNVPHVGLHVRRVVALVAAHNVDGLLGKVTGMQPEARILVLRQDGEGRVARARAYLEERDGAGVRMGYLCQDGELLLQPLAVFEEVGCVVLVEQVPPLGGVCGEAICIVSQSAVCLDKGDVRGKKVRRGRQIRWERKTNFNYK